MANTIVWADIPVADMDRARTFYGAVLEAEIPLMDGANGDVALLPMERGDAGADLVRSDSQKPGAAGGQVAMPVSDMGEMVGFIGFFIDSEGNRVGVHKPPQMT